MNSPRPDQTTSAGSKESFKSVRLLLEMMIVFPSHPSYHQTIWDLLESTHPNEAWPWPRVLVYMKYSQSGVSSQQLLIMLAQTKSRHYHNRSSAAIIDMLQLHSCHHSTRPDTRTTVIMYHSPTLLTQSACNDPAAATLIISINWDGLYHSPPTVIPLILIILGKQFSGKPLGSSSWPSIITSVQLLLKSSRSLHVCMVMDWLDCLFITWSKLLWINARVIWSG